MSDPRVYAARLFLRRHLQRARERGAITAAQFAAATAHLLAREVDERLNPDGSLPFEAVEDRLIQQGLLELHVQGLLDEATYHRALDLESGVDARATPMALLPLDTEEQLAAVDAPAPEAPARPRSLTILCPHCETVVPDGALDCAACGRSILMVVDPDTLEPLPPEEVPLRAGDSTDEIPMLGIRRTLAETDPLDQTARISPFERTAGADTDEVQTPADPDAPPDV